jgi:hypothetical protein
VGSAVRALQVIALIAGLVVNLYWATPFYNWDMLAYIATSGCQPAALYRFVIPLPVCRT